MVRNLVSNSLVAWICCLPMLSLAGTIAHQTIPLQDRLRLLQAGGHILVMRHAATDHNQRDLDRSLQPDCAQQRGLSAQGRQDVQSISRSMAALQIPIGKVYTSPYCRTRHTAEEIFGKYEIDPDLQFSISKDAAEAQRLANHLYQAIVDTEPGSTNTVFVSHTSNIRDGIGIWPKPEGTALVIEKTPSALIYRGMIKPEEWPAPADNIN